MVGEIILVIFLTILLLNGFLLNGLIIFYLKKKVVQTAFDLLCIDTAWSVLLHIFFSYCTLVLSLFPEIPYPSFVFVFSIIAVLFRANFNISLLVTIAMKVSFIKRPGFMFDFDDGSLRKYSVMARIALLLIQCGFNIIWPFDGYPFMVRLLFEDPSMFERYLIQNPNGKHSVPKALVFSFNFINHGAGFSLITISLITITYYAEHLAFKANGTSPNQKSVIKILAVFAAFVFTTGLFVFCINLFNIFPTSFMKVFVQVAVCILTLDMIGLIFPFIVIVRNDNLKSFVADFIAYYALFLSE